MKCISYRSSSVQPCSCQEQHLKWRHETGWNMMKTRVEVSLTVAAGFCKIYIFNQERCWRNWRFKTTFVWLKSLPNDNVLDYRWSKLKAVVANYSILTRETKFVCEWVWLAWGGKNAGYQAFHKVNFSAHLFCLKWNKVFCCWKLNGLLLPHKVVQSYCSSTRVCAM